MVGRGQLSALRKGLFVVGLVGATLLVGVDEVCAEELDASTSTAAFAGPEPSAPRTVERRLFTKQGRFHLRAGGAYWAREDFWISPGLTAELGYAPLEWLAVDLSSTVFFSELDAAARDLRVEQGLLPDAQQPILRLVIGPRWSFAYGKILIEGTETVLHLDASLVLRMGAMFTDRAVNFGGDVGLAFQVSLDEGWFAWGEIAGWIGFEERQSSSLAAGPLGSLGLGVQL